MKKILVITLSCLFFSSVWADTFYRWTDEKGVTHYTATPPDGQNSNKVSVSTGTSGPVDLQAKTVAPVSDTPKNEANLFLERCQQYRTNLELLNSDAQLTTKDADGNDVVMDDAARAKHKAETETILRSCPPA